MDKIAFTGSTEVGRHHPPGHGGQRQEALAGAGRQVAVRRLRRRRPGQRGRGRGGRDLVQPGAGLLRRLAPAGAGGRRRAAGREAARAHGDAARRRPARQGGGHRAPSSRPCSCEQITRPGATRARKKARRCGSRRGPARPRAASIRRRCSPTSRPPSTMAQVEIFGPVLVSMTFRTPAEAVALANNTRYGLAASVWTENINLALDVAPQDQGGHGLDQLHQPVRRGQRLRRLPRERLRPRGRPRRAVRVRAVGAAWEDGEGGGDAAARAEQRAPTKSHAANGTTRQASPTSALRPPHSRHRPHAQAVHRRQAGAARLGLQPPRATGLTGAVIGEVGEGNRKDIRNAVEAAHAARRLGTRAPAHNRAQILYYIAENLGRPRRRVRRAARRHDRRAPSRPTREVERAIERLFTYAAWADKYDGAVHHTPLRGVTLAMHEPIGVIGLVCPDELPLLGFVSWSPRPSRWATRSSSIPSRAHPLSATDFYQVLETSDVPAGVVNIVTGAARHARQGAGRARRRGRRLVLRQRRGRRDGRAGSAGNMKRTWVDYGHARDWLDAAGRGPGVPARGHPGQEHLGAVRGVRPSRPIPR